MNKVQVIDYVMSTPDNTNPNILSLMLDNISEGQSETPAIYYHPNMSIEDFEASEYAQNVAPFSLVVVQDDKDETAQNLYYYYVYEDYARKYWYLASGNWTLNEAGFIGDISD